ncbi:MAG: hypothetical protein US89_C0012G0037 [Candidatus Peregrinibacteria bacterium GW2011_GWF2_38_29]|nr:MAG: hypothetical protein US89_C0012G0037 [Candidatus Peregrinibacteria bacterium GW2011_GWF2_38_29]HBB02460.1 hypothetical protein [Candidatus Peregrinibacteria bacterium]
MKRIFTTKVICYKKNDKFIAVALDFDLLDEGDCMVKALSNLHENIISYLKMCVKEHESDKNIYRKAPKKYYDICDLFVELQKKHEEKNENKFLGNLSFNSEHFDKHACCKS